MSQLLKSRYTLDECYTVLDIHPKTFRAWLKEGGITPEHSRADRRIKFLTAAQVERLARLHDKPWPPTASTQEPVIRPEAYKLLLEQLAEADQQAQQISTEHVQLQASIAELREQQEATTRQLAAIEQESREQAEKESQERAALQEQGQQTRAALDSFTTSQQEAAAHLDELVGASKQQQKLLEAMQASQQEAAARLDTLAAESSEHAEQLAQLTAEMDKQGQRQAQLSGRIDELQRQGEQAQHGMQESLEQMQAHTQEQAQEAEKRLQAQFQAALTTLCQQMLEELERRAQGIETEQARDVAALTAQQEQLTSQIENATAKVETATTTALGGQQRIDKAEHRLTSLETGREEEQAARASLAERITRLEAQAATGPEQPQTGRKKISRRQAERP